MKELPIIDISALRNQDAAKKKAVSDALFSACTDRGFFYIVGHGVDAGLQKKLEDLSQSFFRKAEAEKMEIRMEKAGRAWRGYFPLGGELTSGKPDWKEGLYFGEEHADDHPRVLTSTPLHGRNLFPDLPEFRETILIYLEAMKDLSQTVMRGLALSLGLKEDFFLEHFTREPTTLFRIFHYPPPPKDMEVWGVGEHTDYGLLTILKQDEVGGLEVKSPDGWIAAPYVKDSFVCNIGDMLDRLTGGVYTSTPHRVKNRTQLERYSYPYFFDPGFDAVLSQIPLSNALIERARGRKREEERWDFSNVHAYEGTYGDYLLQKVAKVFPDLKAKV